MSQVYFVFCIFCIFLLQHVRLHHVSLVEVAPRNLSVECVHLDGLRDHFAAASDFGRNFVNAEQELGPGDPAGCAELFDRDREKLGRMV